MKKALIDTRDNRICQVIDPVDEFPVHEDLIWVDCDDAVDTTYTYEVVGGDPVFTPPGPSDDFDAARDKKRKALDDYFLSLQDQGATYSGKSYRLSPGVADIYRDFYMLALAAKATYYTWSGINLRATDDSLLTVSTADDMITFGNTVLATDAAVSAAYLKKQLEIDALADDLSVIEAYDVTTDFPGL